MLAADFLLAAPLLEPGAEEVLVPGPNSFPIPRSRNVSMSSGGMIPPPVTRMSSRPASSSSRFTRGNSVRCAPERIDRPTTSTSSWMAAWAIISGV